MTNASLLNQFWMIKKLDLVMEEATQVPFFESANSFDFGRLSTSLAERLSVSSFAIKPLSLQWRGPEELREGLGRDLLIFPIDISALSGAVYWMIPRKDMKKLTSWALTGKNSPQTISSDILQEGFYRYLMLEILDAITEIEPMQTLTPILQESSALPEERAFCIDLSFEWPDGASSGRLMIPQTVCQSWSRYFTIGQGQTISPKLARSLELSLGVQIGSVLLALSEWNKLKRGDFVLLDKGSYDPRHMSGQATLNVQQTPLFQLDLENGKARLLNYAFIYEDATDMKHFEEEEESTDISVDKLEEGESVALKETPIYITVELARLKMPLEKLMQLKPGSSLELPLTSENGVTLSANGKKVGKAELVYLGEKLGIRIVELG